MVFAARTKKQIKRARMERLLPTRVETRYFAVEVLLIKVAQKVTRVTLIQLMPLQCVVLRNFNPKRVLQYQFIVEIPFSRNLEYYVFKKDKNV